MSDDNGTTEIVLVTAQVAASEDILAVPVSLRGETGQLTAEVVGLIALPPAVTRLSEVECNVACSNLVNLVTNMPQELTPS